MEFEIKTPPPGPLPVDKEGELTKVPFELNCSGFGYTGTIHHAPTLTGDKCRGLIYQTPLSGRFQPPTHPENDNRPVEPTTNLSRTWVETHISFRLPEVLTSGVLLLLLLIAFPITAQQAQPTPVITADQVNDIASRLYCPVCENIPLDTCPTAACADWRYEIRLQLEAGKTEAQIVEDFVTRFGDRVVGTPQDPTLRALSLVTPFILMGVVFALLLTVLSTWRKGVRKQKQSPADEVPQSHYYELLEKDLEG